MVSLDCWIEDKHGVCSLLISMVRRWWHIEIVDYICYIVCPETELMLLVPTRLSTSAFFPPYTLIQLQGMFPNAKIAHAVLLE
jgi:hypothetical protein